MSTPKLRFKGFSGDWEKTTIKSAVSFMKDGTHGTHKDEPTSEFFLLSAKNIQNGKVITDDKDRRLSLLEFESIYQNYALQSGDILLTVVGTIGRVAIFKSSYKKYAFQRSVAFMRFKTAKPEFILHMFCANDFQKELLVRQVVSAQAGIYLGDLSKIKINLPSHNEQTKIATFLTAVDEKISQLSQKQELLTQYKKGMMQKLFSQQIRFKADDGSEFGAWEVKTLKEISSKNSIKNKNGLIKEVLTNSATQGIIKQSEYFEREIVTESNLNGYYIVKLDDFVYNPRISVNAPVGPIKRNLKCVGIMSPLYTIFTFKKINLDYISYFFESSYWHDYIKNVSNSGARHDRMNITNTAFFDMPILHPTLPEQTKIANFLSAIDQKIDLTTQQLEQAKQWKKGLLQHMFI
ncbi:restriction endonuclease subunit S [Acinetobacter pollinis]|uniref:Restriction endonuclease subunit S n=1 Tax=Acinetobacter pollinis TaxID=2605270 RepID=A0ABU6DU05_9GAMM|nr:restriction endonuclease subunit S [Acinetobacter pollinis]MEB5477342.1 restriction endonuclease subunit S [Acinetobacter pollinis]